MSLTACGTRCAVGPTSLDFGVAWRGKASTPFNENTANACFSAHLLIAPFRIPKVTLDTLESPVFVGEAA